MIDQVDIKILSIQENTIEAQINISDDLPYFKGHFEDLAILPGIIQVLWAERISRQHFNITGFSSGMQKIKFKSVVFPGASLRLILKIVDDGSRIHFTYYSDEKIHAEGYLMFEH